MLANAQAPQNPAIRKWHGSGSTFDQNPNKVTSMAIFKTGPELIRATKPYASDHPTKSWWAILSTSVLLLVFLGGTLWNFHPAGKLVCSILTGLLILRLFVIYHDQQHHS